MPYPGFARGVRVHRATRFLFRCRPVGPTSHSNVGIGFEQQAQRFQGARRRALDAHRFDRGALVRDARTAPGGRTPGTASHTGEEPTLRSASAVGAATLANANLLRIRCVCCVVGDAPTSQVEQPVPSTHPTHSTSPCSRRKHRRRVRRVADLRAVAKRSPDPASGGLRHPVPRRGPSLPLSRQCPQTWCGHRTGSGAAHLRAPRCAGGAPRR